MANLGSLVVSLSAETAQFRSELASASQLAQRSFRSIESAAKGAAATLLAGLGGAGVVGIFRSLITESEEAQRTLFRTEALLRATGNAVGRSSQTLIEQAKQLSAATLANEQDVLRSQQILLSYTNIVGTQFDRTLELAADLSSLMGTSLPSAIETFAKALDNPVERISALTRIGFNFTEQQKEQIKVLVESNRLYEAQNIILDVAAKSFGGLAQQEARGFAGAQKELAQAVKDSLQSFSDQAGLLEKSDRLMRGLAVAIQETTKYLIDNSTTLKIWVGILVGSGLIAALPKIAAGMMAFAGSVIAVGAALSANKVALALLLITAAAIPAVEALKNWIDSSDEVAKTQEAVTKAITETAGATGNFTGLTEAQKEAAKKLAEEQKTIGQILLQQRDAYVELFGTQEDVLRLRLTELNATKEQIANVLTLSSAIAAENKTRDEQKKALDEILEVAARYKQLIDDTSDPIDKLAAGEAELVRLQDEFIKKGYEEEDVLKRIAIARMNLMDNLFPPNLKTDTDKLIETTKQFGAAIGTAFEDAVIGGKNFSDILKAIEQDIIRIVLRQFVTKPLEGVVSSFAGDFLSGLGARAIGGPVARNTPYLVGEQGPELFVPSTAGSIIPNNQVNGGQQISVVNNFTVSGTTDKRTQQQIAAMAGMSVQRAIARNT